MRGRNRRRERDNEARWSEGKTEKDEKKYILNEFGTQLKKCPHDNSLTTTDNLIYGFAAIGNCHTSKPYKTNGFSMISNNLSHVVK